MKIWTALTVALATFTASGAAFAASSNCLIFVHGTAKDSVSADYLYDPVGALNYWGGGVQTATANGARRYVVHYQGSQAWWQAAADVSAQINHALDGGSDGSGGSCVGATNFVLITYSMGGPVVDFILGNATPGDANYNFNGNYARIASSVAYVISLSGAHRGSEYADAACGNGPWFGCDIVGWFAGSCTASNEWLQTADGYRVETYSSAPDLATYLIEGGADPWDGGCLADPHDGAVAYASGFACGGSATADWSRTSQCSNSYKQETGNFFNVDHTAEDHTQIRTGTYSSAARWCATSDFFWGCTSPGSTVYQQSTMLLLGSMY